MINLIKYKIARWIERFPLISILIYNNANKLKFFLPHEKDYYGILKVCKISNNKSFIDVGANIGISTLGFRNLGFTNPTYLFEPNFFLYKNYLKNVKKKYKNIFINNVALNDRKERKKLYIAYYKGQALHFLSSFDKKYIINSIKITFFNSNKKISILKKNVMCEKFDSIKIKYPPDFIKLDTEGHDYNVLLGMNKTIKKYKPVFLIEYNLKIFSKICKYLKYYKPYIYDFRNDKFLKVSKKNKSQISRTSKQNLLTNRNVFFIPNTRKFIKKI
mgnify:CR=1 FL=1